MIIRQAEKGKRDEDQTSHPEKKAANLYPHILALIFGVDF